MDATRLRDRWRMGIEARALVILTGVLRRVRARDCVQRERDRRHAGGTAATTRLLSRQLIGVGLGVVVFAVAAKIDAEGWEKLGVADHDSHRWCCSLIVSSRSPRHSRRGSTDRGASCSERRFSRRSSRKLAVVLWTSMLVVKKGPAMRRLTKGLLPFLVVIGALDLLVMLEPDLSVAMMFTLVMGIILFAGGVRIGHFVALGVMLIPLLYVKIERLNYVLLRMSAFFDPGAAPQEVSYQLRQSLIAVGSGGFFGVGFGQGRQQYGFLPFGYDDFIASNIGEEWGFVGLVLLIVAFAVYAAARVPHREEGAVARSSSSSRSG